MAPALTLGALIIGTAAVATVILVNALVTLCKAPEQTADDLADADDVYPGNMARRALAAPVHDTAYAPKEQRNNG